MKRASRTARRLALALAATGAFAALLAQPAAADTSSFLAGYQVSEPSISQASVSFIVPTLTCPSPDQQGTLEGIGRMDSSTGAQTVLAGVLDECQGGSALQVSLINWNQAAEGTVAPGDRVRVVFTQTATKETATVIDNAAGTRVSVHKAPDPDNTLTFGSFSMLAPSPPPTPLPVADFGTVRMRNPLVNDTALSTLSPTKFDRTNGTTTEISTGDFRPSGAFDLNFVNN